MYDPELGIMLQADTIIPDGPVTQSLNRYSYVFNNPLSYSDPTGHVPLRNRNDAEKDFKQYAEEQKKTAAVVRATTRKRYEDLKHRAHAKGLNVFSSKNQAIQAGAIFVANSAIGKEAQQFGGEVVSGVTTIAESVNDWVIFPITDGLGYLGGLLDPFQGMASTVQSMGQVAGQYGKGLGVLLYYSSKGLKFVGGLRGAITNLNKVEDVVSNTRVAIKEGEFSIIDWNGYPTGLSKPTTPAKLLQGEEYLNARRAANSANKKIRKNQDLIGKPVDVHEILPVKFNGSPIDPKNKIILDRNKHRQEVTPWWNQLQSDVGG